MLSLPSGTEHIPNNIKLHITTLSQFTSDTYMVLNLETLVGKYNSRTNCSRRFATKKETMGSDVKCKKKENGHAKNLRQGTWWLYKVILLK